MLRRCSLRFGIALRQKDPLQKSQHLPAKRCQIEKIPRRWTNGKVEIGAEILLRISREFGKSIEWLLTG
jgi:hypothetical protein